MLKKLITWITLGCSFGSTIPSATAQTFPDIQGYWAQNCIEQLTQQNIIGGYPDGTFRPESPVTRAEFATLVNRAFPNKEAVRDPINFTDIFSNYWATGEIRDAYSKGFLTGYPGREFRPTENIPRVQAFVALASGLNNSPPNSPIDLLNLTYADAGRIPDYARQQIATATQENIVVNSESNRLWLDPNRNATRIEIAAALCQALPEVSSIPTSYVAREGQYASAFGTIAARNNYKLVSLERFPSPSTQVFATPTEATLETFSLRENSPNTQQQQVSVNYLQPKIAVVMLTQTNLRDDSVSGIRYRVEVVQQFTPAGQSWEILWAGQQFKCQPGRGHQDWSTQLCL